MTERHIGVYPGTFDPVTNGHMDIVSRATRLVDTLIIGIAVNVGKEPLFNLEERVEMVEAEVKTLSFNHGSEIIIKPFDNLLMDFVTDMDAQLIVRGLRAVSDFEYEFQMAGMNAKLNNKVETVFLMASDKHQLIASRLVKEIARLGGDVSQFVSTAVKERLMDKYGFGKS